MGEFFGSMYCWPFENFFGLELADYLWGQASPKQLSNMLIGIGLSMLCISFVMVVIYYYIINHPRLSNWWGWLIFLGINAAINFIVGWQWVLDDKYGKLMVTKSATTGKEVELLINESDILAFGVTNMILAILWFFIFSYVFKWWSTNCSHAPF